MNNYFHTAKNTVLNNKEASAIAAAAIVAVVLLVVVLFLAVQSNAPKIVYMPTAACELFTSDEATMLLGDRAFNSSDKQPVISKNTAVSNCGYTDGNPDKNTMLVAAITVRAGINDEGVQQNKTEFSAGRPTDNIEIVKNLGDSAYFNEKVGQLNILDGRNWIILSYGQGSAPEQNTLKKTTELAQLVVSRTPITSRF